MLTILWNQGYVRPRVSAGGGPSGWVWQPDSRLDVKITDLPDEQEELQIVQLTAIIAIILSDL